MAIYSLPIEKLPININDTIDMSKLCFPVEKSKQNRSALLYLRNTGIKANYIFDECSYEDKEEFLILYLQNNRLNVNIPILLTTWISILTYNRFDIELESILSPDEIKIFHDNNYDFINEIYKFLISIPLCSMKLFNQFNSKNNIDISEFKLTEYDGFNPYILMKLFDYKEIIILSQSINGIKPEFYNYYFNIDCEPYPDFINTIVNKFPHLSLLNIIMNENPKMINSFFDAIQKILSIKE